MTKCKIKGFKEWKLINRLSIFKSEYVLRYTHLYYLSVFPKLESEMKDAYYHYLNFEIKAPMFCAGEKTKFKTITKIQLMIKVQLNAIECKMKNPDNKIQDLQ